MTNKTPFGQRIANIWQELVEHLHPRVAETKPLSPAYFHALSLLGEKALEQSKGMRSEGCRAVILACIQRGLNTRDEIVRTVPRHHDSTYAFTAYLLDDATGDDPAEHLWQKGSDGRYRILRP